MRVYFKNDKLKNYPKGEIMHPSNKGDAGYDLVSVSSPRIVGDMYMEGLYKNIKYIEYETNIILQPSTDDFKDYSIYSLLFPRSSISKYNLSLCNSVGVIDSGYSDTIKVRFNYLPQPENYYIMKEGKNLLIGVDQSSIYQKGDKIAQIIFQNHIHPKILKMKKISETERGLGGFGSTGV